MTQIDAFFEKYYNSVLLEVTELVKDKISENRELLIDTIKKYFEQYFSELAEIQKKELPLSVYFVHISFLFISIQEEAIRLKVDAYPESGIVGTASMYTKDFRIGQLNEIIEQTKEKLLAYAKKDNVAPFVHESIIEQMVLRMVTSLQRYLFEFYKYYYKDFFRSHALEQVLLCEDFYITYGEYYNWQKPIFAKRPTIDIFNRDDEDALHFREFENFIYNDKTFSSLEIKNSAFINCKFQNSRLMNCEWIDCTFENCTFEDVVFRDTKIIGATFEDCHINRCTFEGVVFYQDTMGNTTVFKLYKPVEFVDVEMKNSTFERCDLMRGKLYDCVVENCDFVNTKLDFSDFEPYGKEDF